MKTSELKEKLHRYIESAGEKKLKAIYTLVEEEIDETTNHWEDKDFVEELERRERSYLNGTAKTYSLKEAMQRVDDAVKKAKK